MKIQSQSGLRAVLLGLWHCGSAPNTPKAVQLGFHPNHGSLLLAAVCSIA